ncbi:MAG: DUF6174 domain-containing protein [Balneola sp.]
MKKSILIPLFALLLFSACDRDGVSNAELRKLEKAKETWQKTKTPDYSFNYRQSCFCAYFGEVKIQVFADTVYAVVNPETGEDATIETENGDEKLLDLYPTLFLTIDELFEELEEAAMIADEMEGSYDNDRGYPKQVSIDYLKDAIDDEVSHLISNYQVLTLTNK